MQLKDKTKSHKRPEGQWKFVGADICTINNKYYLWIVHYTGKLAVVNQVEEFNADNIIKCKIIFSEYMLLNKIV